MIPPALPVFPPATAFLFRPLAAQQAPCVSSSGSRGQGSKRAPTPVHSSSPGFGDGSNKSIDVIPIVEDMERGSDHPRKNSSSDGSVKQSGSRGRGKGTGKGERTASNGPLPRISGTGAASAGGGLSGGPGMNPPPDTVAGRAVNHEDDKTSERPAGAGEEGFVRMTMTAIEPAGFATDPDVEATKGKDGENALLGSDRGGRRVTGSGGEARKRAAVRAKVGDHGGKGMGTRRETRKGTSKKGTERSNGKAGRRAGAAGKRAVSSRNDVASLGENATKEEQEVLAGNGGVEDQDPVVKRTKRPRKRRCVREGGGAGDKGTERDILGASPSGGRLAKKRAAKESFAYWQGDLDPKNGDSRQCQFPSCTRTPFYGLEDEKRAAFCSQHRLAGMVNVVSPKCVHEGCRRGPSYNEPSESKPAFCSGHRLPGMINVVSPRCHHLGCTRGPSYGHAVDRKAIFCSGHRLHGMVNVVSRHCMEDGCLKGPSYGFEGMRASFCAKHKRCGMVNVVSPRCQAPNCIRGPCYGMPSDRKPSFCAKHKQDGMTNVVTPKCSEPGCERGTTFGMDGDRRASFCALHKLDGMVQITPRSK